MKAQDSGIAGRITDAAGNVVATAVVTATQVDSGARRQVLCSALGRFRIAGLLPGNYRIEAVKPGFKPLLRTGIDLTSGSTATLDLQMDDKAISETAVFAARAGGSASILASMCAFAPRSGCEMAEAVKASFVLDMTAFREFLP